MRWPVTLKPPGLIREVDREARRRGLRKTDFLRIDLESILWRRSRVLLAIYWPLLAVATHYPESEIETLDLGSSGLDRPVHVACFVLLTILLLYAQGRQRHRNRGPHALLIAALTAGVYAVVDELTQGWFGRSVEMTDLLANYAGIALVTLGAWWRPPRSFPDPGYTDPR